MIARKERMHLEKVLVCDWLDQYGGAERVIKSLCEILHPDRTFAMISVMKPADLELMGFADTKIEETFLRCFGKKFRCAVPLFPAAVRSISRKLPRNCLIVSSSHCVAKGVTSEGSLHICYVQARNMKYIWEEKDQYLHGLKRIANLWTPYLRRYDVRSARLPDHLVANSQYVADWMRARYGRSSTVIYPPVEITRFCPESVKDDYFIYTGRLEPYKRIDLVVRTFNELKKRLIVVGEGSRRRYLESIAGNQVEFLGYQRPDVIASLLAKARAFLMPNAEDFGIAPVEAMASGTPVIAYAGGGAMETIIDGVTGVLFSEQTVDGLKQGVQRFMEVEPRFDAAAIREHAEAFSEDVFKVKMARFIEERLQESSLVHD